ncbi:MAG: ParA family protein [Bacteroidota bacterium]
MREIVVLNTKGGSGKSTTAVNLSAALAEMGQRILLIDCDPQASASRWLIEPAVEIGLSMADVFTSRAELLEVIRATAVSGLDVAPATSELARAEVDLANMRQAPDRVLRRKIAPAISSGRWDYIFVDTPGKASFLQSNAVMAVREAIIPVTAQALSLDPLTEVLRMIAEAREYAEHSITVAGVVISRFDGRTNHARDVEAEIRSFFNNPEVRAIAPAGVFTTVIRESVRIAEAPSFGQPITLYRPISGGAEDFRNLAAELIAQETTRGNDGKE